MGMVSFGQAVVIVVLLLGASGTKYVEESPQKHQPRTRLDAILQHVEQMGSYKITLCAVSDLSETLLIIHQRLNHRSIPHSMRIMLEAMKRRHLCFNRPLVARAYEIPIECSVRAGYMTLSVAQSRGPTFVHETCYSANALKVISTTLTDSGVPTAYLWNHPEKLARPETHLQNTPLSVVRLLRAVGWPVTAEHNNFFGMCKQIMDALEVFSAFRNQVTEYELSKVRPINASAVLQWVESLYCGDALYRSSPSHACDLEGTYYAMRVHEALMRPEEDSADIEARLDATAVNTIHTKHKAMKRRLAKHLFHDSDGFSFCLHNWNVMDQFFAVWLVNRFHLWHGASRSRADCARFILSLQYEDGSFSQKDHASIPGSPSMTLAAIRTLEELSALTDLRVPFLEGRDDRSCISGPIWNVPSRRFLLNDTGDVCKLAAAFLIVSILCLLIVPATQLPCVSIKDQLHRRQSVPRGIF